MICFTSTSNDWFPRTDGGSNCSIEVGYSKAEPVVENPKTHFDTDLQIFMEAYFRLTLKGATCNYQSRAPNN